MYSQVTHEKKTGASETVVGGLSDDVLNHARAQGLDPANGAITLSDKAIGHMLRDSKKDGGRAISAEDLFSLPDVLSHPKAIFFDKQNGSYLYVYDTKEKDKLMKIVVKLDRIELKKNKEHKGGREWASGVVTGGIVDRKNIYSESRYEKIYEK
jgi:hypothetical protein